MQSDTMLWHLHFGRFTLRLHIECVLEKYEIIQDVGVSLFASLSIWILWKGGDNSLYVFILIKYF